jgi:phosphocarrier protein
MKEIEIVVANRLGLHARAAARFVQCANRFHARITVERNDERADGKSILGLLTLAAARGTELRLRAEGEDEDEALDELARLVRGGFGEAG